MTDLRAAALAMPTADEWNRLVLAVNGLQSDLGRIRKDYRELEMRVSLVEREQESAEDAGAVTTNG